MLLGTRLITVRSISVAALAMLISGSAKSQTMSAEELIRKSVAANESDWKALPHYTHEERDIEGKLDSNGKLRNKDDRTFRVMMIDGSQYNQLIAVNGEPLAHEQQQEEKAKLAAIKEKRASESASARRSRIEKYQKDRAEEHLLMQQMVAAFQFRLVGAEKVGGHDCYLLEAIPNPDYRPPVTKARVLTGMQGKLWIDKNRYHWVRVHAEVVKPVEFGLFLAKVRPGTEFELDQAPIDEGIWLPSHFSQSVNARVLGVYSLRSRRDEYYTNYRRDDFGSAPKAAITRAE